MAETVLSMARSVVGSAVSKAASAAADEMSLLMGVQKEIWFIKDELKTIQAFLITPEVTKKKDKLVKVWAEQVQELSYDIEDCLDEFMVHVGNKRLSQQLMNLKDRRRIAIQIRNLKSRVEEVSRRNTRYNLIKTEASSTTDEMDSYMEDVRNHSASNINEAELVGFSKPKEELLNLIDVHANNGPAQVVCVVGMGGLGKTTIARKIYESKKDIAKNFSCCAWITVSQSFVRMELLKDMFRGLFGGEALKKRLKELEGKVGIDDLASYLREELNEKRYFVVLDDLWSIDAWKWINSIAFPTNNIKGSRIIVTTRDVGLAELCTSGSLIYHLKPLQEHDAKDLLLRKTNARNEDMENDENMSNIVIKIVKKCGCLPLAILTIGGVLATKKVTEWGNFYKQLPSELESNPGLEAMRRMVTLSYNYLPSHLKPCFLYLSIFPEDFQIERRRLVDRWIAEGFVKARAGMTIEDVGKCYFNELINRSMIQLSRVSLKGAPKSCRVHDIMRDIIVSISREENFVFLTGDIGTDVVQENTRHIAFHGSKCAKTSFDWNIIRSLTLFGERPNELAPSLCLPQLRMLRVLDLEDAQFSITQKDISNMALLRHLKYLRVEGFEYSYIYSLPRSIGKLQGLQTLDLCWTYIATLPTEISKLHGLRSLCCSRIPNYPYFDLDRPKRCLSNTMCLPKIFTPLVDPVTRAMRIAELHMATSSCWSKTNGVKVPKGIGSLRELQILEVVDIKRTSSKAIEELGELTQLRKLRVTTQGASEQKHKILGEAIQKLSSLQSLGVDAIGFSNTGTLEFMNYVSSPRPLLRTLKLCGYLGEMPDLIGSLTQLVKIFLWGSRLNEGSRTMEILGALPNLMLLHLALNAYVGEKLVFREGAFPNLRKLYIVGLERLREVRFEEGAQPQMEEIEIIKCRLELGIIGIKHLPRLKEISLGDGSKVANLGMLQEEVDAHPNHPVLLMEENRSDHDLGDVQGFEEVAVEATESLAEPEGESSQVATLMTDDRSILHGSYFPFRSRSSCYQLGCFALTILLSCYLCYQCVLMLLIAS